MTENSPAKRYFTIREASRLSGVPEYSIRYWEKEFAILRPVRRTSGHRLFTREDIDVLLKVKDLVYKKKMKLEGAKKALRPAPASTENATAKTDAHTQKLLREIHKELCAILKEC